MNRPMVNVFHYEVINLCITNIVTTSFEGNMFGWFFLQGQILGARKYFLIYVYEKTKSD